MPVSKDIFDPQQSVAEEGLLEHSAEESSSINRVDELVNGPTEISIDQIQRESLLFRAEEKVEKATPALDQSLKILNIAAVIAGFFAFVAVLLIAGVVWEDAKVHDALRQSHFFKENPHTQTR